MAAPPSVEARTRDSLRRDGGHPAVQGGHRRIQELVTEWACPPLNHPGLSYRDPVTAEDGRVYERHGHREAHPVCSRVALARDQRGHGLQAVGGGASAQHASLQVLVKRGAIGGEKGVFVEEADRRRKVGCRVSAEGAAGGDAKAVLLLVEMNYNGWRGLEDTQAYAWYDRAADLLSLAAKKKCTLEEGRG